MCDGPFWWDGGCEDWFVHQRQLHQYTRTTLCSANVPPPVYQCQHCKQAPVPKAYYVMQAIGIMGAQNDASWTFRRYLPVSKVQLVAKNCSQTLPGSQLDIYSDIN